MRADFSDDLRGSVGQRFLGLPFLRIAVPSWRFVGIARKAEAVRPAVSREEIASLFERDLTALARRRRSLTNGERAEKDRASRIRSALYS